MADFCSQLTLHTLSSIVLTSLTSLLMAMASKSPPPPTASPIASSTRLPCFCRSGFWVRQASETFRKTVLKPGRPKASSGGKYVPPACSNAFKAAEGLARRAVLLHLDLYNKASLLAKGSSLAGRWSQESFAKIGRVLAESAEVTHASDSPTMGSKVGVRKTDIGHPPPPEIAWTYVICRKHLLNNPATHKPAMPCHMHS